MKPEKQYTFFLCTECALESYLRKIHYPFSTLTEEDFEDMSDVLSDTAIKLYDKYVDDKSPLTDVCQLRHSFYHNSNYEIIDEMISKMDERTDDLFHTILIDGDWNSMHNLFVFILKQIVDVYEKSK